MPNRTFRDARGGPFRAPVGDDAAFLHQGQPGPPRSVASPSPLALPTPNGDSCGKTVQMREQHSFANA